jgi:hypothetical protein
MGIGKRLLVWFYASGLAVWAFCSLAAVVCFSVNIHRFYRIVFPFINTTVGCYFLDRGTALVHHIHSLGIVSCQLEGKMPPHTHRNGPGGARPHVGRKELGRNRSSFVEFCLGLSWREGGGDDLKRRLERQLVSFGVASVLAGRSAD